MAPSFPYDGDLFIPTYAAAARRAPDLAGIAATVADGGPPLVGPAEPDYAAQLNAATRRWIRRRWPPGSMPPSTMTGAG